MAQHLSDILDAYERAGRFNVRGEELRSAFRHENERSLPKALYRQQQAGRLAHLSRGAGHWLIIPLQYATVGSPPLETWLDSYLRKTLQVPYYVGLLSAAETYGAAPYGVMVTQVMVPRPRRPITVGRHKVVFHVCSDIETMPTRWHESPQGRFKVSSPELTALDLIQRASALGGMSRVTEVLRAMWSHCTPAGLNEALDALANVPTAQRLGAILPENEADLLGALSQWLNDKPSRLVALEGTLPPRPLRNRNQINTDFKVWLPPLRKANI